MQIDHQCPQCGAAVTLDETDRLLQCSFCKTRLFIEPQDYFRYAFSFPGSDIGEVFWVPYWRFKGMHFSCRTGRVTSNTMDKNSIAVERKDLPASLGIRPQVMKLRFANQLPAARLLKPELMFDRSSVESTNPVSYELVTTHETRLVDLGNDDFAEVPVTRTELKEDKLYYECFISENTSTIYAPFVRRDSGIFDPISNKQILNSSDFFNTTQVSFNELAVRSISTLCPNCGWELIAEKDSCILLCNHCNNAWQAKEGSFRNVSFVISLPADCMNRAFFLPFWKLGVIIQGTNLLSHEDLSRCANITKLPAKKRNTSGINFWIPAFKIAPPAFLRAARQMTLANPENEFVPEFGNNPCYPPNLAGNETIDFLKVALAEIVANKKVFMPQLEGIDITIKDSLLVFYPFTDSGYELTDREANCSIMKNALRWGKNL